MRCRHLVAAVLCAIPAHVALSQSNSPRLGSIEATADFVKTFPPSVRELPNRWVLASEASGRLVLLDSTLQFIRIVVDSAPVYGGRINHGQLIPWTADTTIYVDGATPFLYIISPLGDLVGTRPVPRPGDQVYLRRSNGVPARDHAGRIVFAGYELGSDTLTILRVDPVSSGAITPVARTLQLRIADSDLHIRPIALSDDWAVLTDGSILVLRQGDFTIERYRPGYAFPDSSRIPFVAIPISDSAKASIVDSVHRLSLNAANNMPLTADGMLRRLPGPHILTEVVPAGQLPDKYPPFVPNSTISGPDTTVWITEFRNYARKDSVIVSIVFGGSRFPQRTRITLPPDTQLLGFGKGVVFLWARTQRQLWRVRQR